MANPQLREEFDQMPPAEQIRLVQELWDRIASRPENIPVRPSHFDELTRRYAEHQESPDDTIDWTDIKKTLRPHE